MSGKCVYYLAHRGVGKVVEDIDNYKKRENELKNMTDISIIGCGDNLKSADKKYKISQQKEVNKMKKRREKIKLEKEKLKNNNNKKSKKNSNYKKSKKNSNYKKSKKDDNKKSKKNNKNKKRNIFQKFFFQFKN